MKPKTARRFLSRSTWKMAGGKIFPPSFYRRINQAKVVLGADPLKIDDNRLVDRSSQTNLRGCLGLKGGSL